MFWRFFEPYGFLNTEGAHESQRERISQRLFGLTFWGDYGGDIITRFHYDYLLKWAGSAVESLPAAHGQGLILKDGATIPRLVLEFIAYFTPESPSHGDYPIFDDNEFSDWEWDKIEEEMTSGWWAKYTRSELVRAFEDITDWDGILNLVPEIGTEEWAVLVYDVTGGDDRDDNPYWESADSLIAQFDMELALDWMLSEYAKVVAPSGEPLFEIEED